MSDTDTTRLRTLPDPSDTMMLRRVPWSAAVAAPHRPAAPGDDRGGDGDGEGARSDEGGGDSLFRNAYALMLSTAVSAALGLGFWLVAARYYSQEAVGEGSAAIAAMRLLASVTATTMIGAVVRYVPRAGRRTGPLVWRMYLVSSIVVTVVSTGFLLTLPLWGDSYEPLGGLWPGVAFVLSCVGWALLTLQDGVLTGLRQAFWVPIGNAVFSIGKLLLLAAFATALPVLGIFVSWGAAIAFSTAPLAWLIFRRLIPRQSAADRDREPPRLREIARFLAGDSVGAMFSLAMINLLPVMVAVRFDATDNGYFYIAYTVGGTMEFMAINMASSLTAHASHSPETLAAGVRGALRRMALLLVPVVGVLVLFAPLILAPFGASYAENGTTVLRLLAAAALPRVAVELYIGVLRVQGRTGMLAVVQGLMCALVLGSAAMMLGPAGISGAGWAMLLSMLVMAVVVAPGLRGALAGKEPAPSKLWARLVARGPAKKAEYGSDWARKAAERRDRVARDEEEYGAAYVWSGHDTATPAFGIPVFVPPEPKETVPVEQPSGPAESRVALALWLLLGLAVALFWGPLLAAPDLPPSAVLSGKELLKALPPVTVAAVVLLIVVQSAALSLLRPRAGLLSAASVVTFAALHTAPAALGWEPEPADGAWYETLARFLGAAAGWSDPEGALRWLPTVSQFFLLVALMALARTLRVPEEAQWGALWVLVVCGWALQRALAPVALPLQLLLTVAVLALIVTRAVRSSRTSLEGAGRSNAGDGRRAG
ncbi:lipopolysaccharide biosynthesis protein [Streptomyces sp. NPDC020875]|uniref:lipopolysaccharide biosynthesis protein n=1 Tax=Streptomyces sp. NPDC020875 TaxID=3154898 RepID=UPI0033BFC10F